MLLPALANDHDRPGRPIDSDRQREYIDAILYVLRTGCPWRHLPHDFEVSWSSAHQQFLRWTRRGVADAILVELREAARRNNGRGATPTAAVVDSSSVKGSPVAGERGFDGAKKIDGIKRHILVDTSGLLLAVEVSAANWPRQPGSASTSCPDPKTRPGGKVQPRRWVVERTHAWINRNRRLVRQRETTLDAHTGFLILSQIAVLFKRLIK